MRIVLDTNVLVRANIKLQGPARELLLKIAYSDHVLITSPFLLREVERALAYPRLQKLWRLTLQDIQEHVQFLVQISEVVHPSIEAPVVLNDRDDDPVVYTAIDERRTCSAHLIGISMSRKLLPSVGSGAYLSLPT